MSYIDDNQAIKIKIDDLNENLNSPALKEETILQCQEFLKGQSEKKDVLLKTIYAVLDSKNSAFIDVLLSNKEKETEKEKNQSYLEYYVENFERKDDKFFKMAMKSVISTGHITAITAVTNKIRFDRYLQSISENDASQTFRELLNILSTSSSENKAREIQSLATQALTKINIETVKLNLIHLQECLNLEIDDEKRIFVIKAIFNLKNINAVYALRKADLEFYFNSTVLPEHTMLMTNAVLHTEEASLIDKLEKENILQCLKETNNHANMLCTLKNSHRLDDITNLVETDTLIFYIRLNDLTLEIKISLISEIFKRQNKEDIKKLKLGELQLYLPACKKIEKELVLKNTCAFISNETLTSHERSYVVRLILVHVRLLEISNLRNDDIFQFLNECLQEENWEANPIIFSIQILLSRIEKNHNDEKEVWGKILLFIEQVNSEKLYALLSATITIPEKIKIEIIAKLCRQKDITMVSLSDLLLYLLYCKDKNQCDFVTAAIYNFNDKDIETYFDNNASPAHTVLITDVVIHKNNQSLTRKLEKHHLEKYLKQPNLSEEKRQRALVVIANTNYVDLISMLKENDRLFYMRERQNGLINFSPPMLIKIIDEMFLHKENYTIANFLTAEDLFLYIKECETQEKFLPVVEAIYDLENDDARQALSDDYHEAYLTACTDDQERRLEIVAQLIKRKNNVLLIKKTTTDDLVEYVNQSSLSDEDRLLTLRLIASAERFDVIPALKTDHLILYIKSENPAPAFKLSMIREILMRPIESDAKKLTSGEISLFLEETKLEELQKLLKSKANLPKEIIIKIIYELFRRNDENLELYLDHDVMSEHAILVIDAIISNNNLSLFKKLEQIHIENYLKQEDLTKEKRHLALIAIVNSDYIDIIPKLNKSDRIFYMLSRKNKLQTFSQFIWLKIIDVIFSLQEHDIIANFLTITDFQLYLLNLKDPRKRLPVIIIIYDFNNNTYRRSLSSSDHELYLENCTEPEKRPEIIFQILQSGDLEAASRLNLEELKKLVNGDDIATRLLAIKAIFNSKDLNIICQLEKEHLEFYFNYGPTIEHDSLLTEAMVRTEDKHLIDKLKSENIAQCINASLTEEDKIYLFCIAINTKRLDVFERININYLISCLVSEKVAPDIKLSIINYLINCNRKSFSLEKLKTKDIRCYLQQCNIIKEKQLIIREMLHRDDVEENEKDNLLEDLINQIDLNADIKERCLSLESVLEAKNKKNIKKLTSKEKYKKLFFEYLRFQKNETECIKAVKLILDTKEFDLIEYLLEYEYLVEKPTGISLSFLQYALCKLSLMPGRLIFLEWMEMIIFLRFKPLIEKIANEWIYESFCLKQHYLELYLSCVEDDKEKLQNCLTELRAVNSLSVNEKLTAWGFVDKPASKAGKDLCATMKITKKISSSSINNGNVSQDLPNNTVVSTDNILSLDIIGEPVSNTNNTSSSARPSNQNNTSINQSSTMYFNHKTKRGPGRPPTNGNKKQKLGLGKA